MLRRVALVITDVWDKLSLSFCISSQRALLVTANVVPSSPILDTLMMDALSSPKHRFLQKAHGVTSQKTAFFIATAMKTSNLIYHFFQAHLFQSEHGLLFIFKMNTLIPLKLTMLHGVTSQGSSLSFV
jgi:hypothetical protein